MGILSRDTSPEAERFQIELMRQAGPTRRFALARWLQTVMELAPWRHPSPSSDADEEEVGFIFIHPLRPELARAGPS